MATVLDTTNVTVNAQTPTISETTPVSLIINNTLFLEGYCTRFQIERFKPNI